MDAIIQWDTELFLYLNGLGVPKWDKFWLVVTDRDTWIPLYFLLAFLLYYKLGWKKALLVIFVAAIGVTFSDQITNLFKHSVQRFRPCHQEEIASVMRLVRDGCGGKYGFFSGHASNHMFVAVFISSVFKKKFGNWFFLALLLWALLIGYSRIYVGAHFPLDVLCGFLNGALVGFGMIKFYHFLLKKFIKVFAKT